MELPHQNRKTVELEHLHHQLKIYKQTYIGRPLLPKQANTYIQLTRFIMQLAHTLHSHYYGSLSVNENNNIDNVISTVSQDLLTKLKSLADRLQKRQNSDWVRKQNLQLCRICMHEIREVEVSHVKDTLSGREELNQNILKIIKEVQNQSAPFNVDEDRQFFKQLKLALQKKEEVMEICLSQGQEYTKMIQNQLSQMMIAKQLFFNQKIPGIDGDTIMGAELKNDVIKSLKNQFKDKLPVLIGNIQKSIRQKDERDKKLHRISIQVQTHEVESPKIQELKRKVAAIEATFGQLNSEKSQLQWTIQQKQIMIDKLTRQLNFLHEQINMKTFTLQKEIKVLQDKNKIFKDEIQKQKSRRDLDRQDSQNNLRTMKSFHKSKDANDTIPPTPSVQEQDIIDRKIKQKKTLNTTTKGSNKFFFPTLSKIKINQQNQLIPSNNDILSQTAYPKDQRLIMTQMLQKNEIQKSIELQMANDSKFKKTGMSSSGAAQRSKKELKRMLTLANQREDDIIDKEPIKKKEGLIKGMRTDRERQNHVSIQEDLRLTHKISINSDYSTKLQKQGKLIKLDSIMRHKQDPIKVKQIQNVAEMKQSARQVSQQMRNKNDRSSFSSEISNKSIFHNMKREETEQHTKKSSIYKTVYTPKDKSLQYSDDTMMVTTPNTKSLKQRENSKITLRNSFSRINQEIDKQNYMTPMMTKQSQSGTNTPTLLIKSQIQSLFFKMNNQSNPKIQMQQFTSLFMKCLQIAQKKNISNQNKQKISFQSINIHQLLQSPRKLNIEALKKQGRINQKHKHDMVMLKSRLQTQLQKQSKENSNSISRDHSYEMSKNRSNKESKKNLGTQSKQFEVTKNGLNLFLNEQMAYQYETGYTKKNHKQWQVSTLTLEMQQYVSVVFDKLQKMKIVSNNNYQQLCSYLRYPFTSTQKGSLQIDIIQSISLLSLTQCFQRIKPYHKNCKLQQGLCSHLILFNKRIDDILLKN